MAEPGVIDEREEHLECVNLVWEGSPREGESVPGRYCVNRLGVVHALDCPVYQGITCCLFEPRPEGEEPVPSSEEEVAAVRSRLAQDYLRWSYWKRVERLSRDEPVPEEPERTAVTEQGEIAEEEEAEIVRTELEKPPEEEALREKYPGQRRSEDRMRARRPAADEPAPVDKAMDVEILEASTDASEPTPEKVAEPDAESKEERPRRPRRNRRRRGRRGRGKRGPPPSSS